MAHYTDQVSPSSEHISRQGSSQRIEEQHSPLINTITAIAVSIISTVLCYMTLPPQGATPVVAVVWILAYYLSFGSDCLDNASLPSPLHNPPMRKSPKDSSPPYKLYNQKKKHFISPQKRLETELLPGRHPSHAVESGQMTNPTKKSDYEVHSDRVRRKKAQKHEESLARLEREKSEKKEGKALSLSNRVTKAFGKLTGASDSD